MSQKVIILIKSRSGHKHVHRCRVSPPTHFDFGHSNGKLENRSAFLKLNTIMFAFNDHYKYAVQNLNLTVFLPEFKC